MRATRAWTPLSRRPSYSLTELMAFADLELPYIPFHFPSTATEDRGPFLQSRADAAGHRSLRVFLAFLSILTVPGRLRPATTWLLPDVAFRRLPLRRR